MKTPDNSISVPVVPGVVNAETSAEHALRVKTADEKYLIPKTDIESNLGKKVAKDKFNPEEISLNLECEKKINEAGGFDELFDALDSFGNEVPGANSKNVGAIPTETLKLFISKYRSGDAVIYVKDMLGNLGDASKALKGITDAFGIRKKVFDLLEKEGSGKFIKTDGSIVERMTKIEPEFKIKIESSNNFEELFEAIDSFGESIPNKELRIIIVNNLKVSINKYRSGETPINVSDIINSLKNHSDGSEALKDIHKEYGFRKKVYELLRNEDSVKYVTLKGEIKNADKKNIKDDGDSKDVVAIVDDLQKNEQVVNNEVQDVSEQVEKVTVPLENKQENILDVVNIEQEDYAKEGLDKLFKDGFLKKIGIDNEESLEKAKDLICEIDGRKVVLVNILGVTVPFYCSQNGTGGKNKGKWYPFFGFAKRKDNDGSEYGWFIKGGNEMENGYNLKSLKNAMDKLNSTLGDINSVSYKVAEGDKGVIFYGGLGKKFEADNFGDSFNELAGIPSSDKQKNEEGFSYGNIIRSITDSVRKKEEEMKREMKDTA